ncbi:MAG: carbamoyltransferase HypF, partial [Thermoanaerobaculales bacterium]
CVLSCTVVSTRAKAQGMMRVRLRCRGTVQGVGFRPAVHRLASSLGLGGWVVNDPQGATVEIEGETRVVNDFIHRLASELPPLARLERMEREPCEPKGASDFEVRSSTIGRRQGALVPPDAALCVDCRREMATASDRRFRYPFTTCTNCGPRFSLVHELPYDRERTSMACFPLCEDCRKEYEDPDDRRFHAEPIACPVCGPRLWVADAGGDELSSVADPLAHVRNRLSAGEIVAIKGLGGFQLACRADASEVVERLRERKNRHGKPLAVMVRDLDEARKLVRFDAESEELMLSPRAPIVLAPRRRPSEVADEVAPGLDDLGVMLPTTPLHVELFTDRNVGPLVMTSGNLSEEPLARTNRDAVARLLGIADCFLLHDRDVVRRVDDSVVRSTNRGPMVVRRARGWVPEPLALPAKTTEAIVAVGGHLQVTSCVACGEQAFLSQHVGDLDSVGAREFLAEAVDGMLDFLQLRPGLIVADEHPEYPSRWLAQQLASWYGVKLLSVQHHLAHAAAVLAEHGRFPGPTESCLAIVLDGTGWGPDGTAWGGEWLSISGALEWRRLAFLEPLPLIGGEAAVREPWRVAVAALVEADAVDLLALTPLAMQVEDQKRTAILRLAEDRGWPVASGAGRLFEAAGALLGVAPINRWEGEAAARLEGLAAPEWGRVEPWPEIEVVDGDSGPVLPSALFLAKVAERVASGESPTIVAAGFHATFCHLAAEITGLLGLPGGAVVALGGGCLVNRLLGDRLVEELEARGFEVLLPRDVPPGDGGLSYGQAAIAAVAAARGVQPRQVIVKTLEC